MTDPHIRTTPRPLSTPTRWLTIAAALLLLVAACSGGSDDADASSMEDAFAATEAMAEGPMSDDGMDFAESEAMSEESMSVGAAARDEVLETATTAAMGEDFSGDALAAGAPTTASDLNRDIIKTAWISVQTANVAAAAAQANSIIEGLGGFTFSQETTARGPAHTTLTFKIRPGNFDTALARLSGVGELVEQSVTSEDVTDIVVDLNSRIRTAEISVDRLREFLSQATEVQGVAELERELANRETNLERLRGQLRTLSDRVALATITLSITQSVEAIPHTAAVLRAWMALDDEDPCLGFQDLTTPPEGEVGFCVEVENEGETTLTEVLLSSNELRFNNDDLTVYEGSDLQRIAPGERAIATLRVPIEDGRVAGRVATRGLEIIVRMSAVPVTEMGTELARLARSQGLYLHVEEEDSPPGFGDALSGGWDALVGAGNGVLLVVGAVLPFLPVIAIVLLLAWWWLRHRRARRSRPGSEVSVS